MAEFTAFTRPSPQLLGAQANLAKVEKLLSLQTYHKRPSKLTQGYQELAQALRDEIAGLQS